MKFDQYYCVCVFDGPLLDVIEQPVKEQWNDASYILRPKSRQFFPCTKGAIKTPPKFKFDDEVGHSQLFWCLPELTNSWNNVGILSKFGQAATFVVIFTNKKETGFLFCFHLEIEPKSNVFLFFPPN